MWHRMEIGIFETLRIVAASASVARFKMTTDFTASKCMKITASYEAAETIRQRTRAIEKKEHALHVPLERGKITVV